MYETDDLVSRYEDTARRFATLERLGERTNNNNNIDNNDLSEFVRTGKLVGTPKTTTNSLPLPKLGLSSSWFRSGKFYIHLT